MMCIGLLISIVDMVPVELIPEFEGLLEVWIALFGRSEPPAVADICHQFWVHDKTFKNGYLIHLFPKMRTCVVFAAHTRRINCDFYSHNAARSCRTREPDAYT